MDIVTMASVRGLFNAIAEEYPVLEEKLSAKFGDSTRQDFLVSHSQIAIGEN